jgi:uncharacterized protein (DUF983 family)
MSGAIRTCPHCGETFERRLFGISLFVRRLERCPACGKWVMIQAFGRKKKSASEGPSDKVISVSVGLSEEERLRQRIEESKYE